MSLGDFKNKIGYVDREYAPLEAREYTNKKYRDLDFIIQSHFIYSTRFTDIEKKVMPIKGGKIPRSTALYIAYRYIYDGDIQKTAKYLVSVPSEIEETVERISLSTKN